MLSFTYQYVFQGSLLLCLTHFFKREHDRFFKDATYRYSGTKQPYTYWEVGFQRLSKRNKDRRMMISF